MNFIVLIHYEGTAFIEDVSNLDIYPFRRTLSAHKNYLGKLTYFDGKSIDNQKCTFFPIRSTKGNRQC